MIPLLVALGFLFAFLFGGALCGIFIVGARYDVQEDLVSEVDDDVAS